MGGKKRQTDTTCRAPTSQRRLGCALARRGASVLADGFGPGTHRLPDTARRFLPPEGKFSHVRFWRARIWERHSAEGLVVSQFESGVTLNAARECVRLTANSDDTTSGIAF